MSQQPPQIEAWKLYENLILLAMKRGVFDQLTELDKFRSVIQYIKEDNIIDDVIVAVKVFSDKMLRSGAVYTHIEAAFVVGLVKFLTDQNELQKSRKTATDVVNASLRQEMPPPSKSASRVQSNAMVETPKGHEKIENSDIDNVS